jgi:transposase
VCEEVGVRWTTPYRIELSEHERSEIEQRARSSNAPYRQVIRARIVLYAADGMENAAIAARLDSTREFVSRVRKRFVEERLKALEERPRSGRPPRFSP